MQSRLHLGQGDFQKGVEVASHKLRLNDPVLGGVAADAPALGLHHQVIGGAGLEPVEQAAQTQQ
jgi:hypothetical protein